MNRRGSVEWELETVGKMIFAIIVILAIFYILYQFSGLLVGSERYSRARVNQNLLLERIEDAVKDGEASVILNFPPNKALIGWSKDTEYYAFQGEDNTFIQMFDVFGGKESVSFSIQRPDCDGACLCLYTLDRTMSVVESELVPDLDHCATIEDIDNIYGTQESLELTEQGWLWGDIYVSSSSQENGEFAFMTMAGTPTMVMISIKDKDVMLTSAVDE